MGNVLSDEKQQQVFALGRLGWSLRRIEDATGVRRETASGYLRAAGVGIRPPRRWGKSKPANEGTTEVSEPEAEGAGAKPANEGTTDSMPRGRAGVRHMSASIVAPYVELVRQRLEVGRNGRAIYEELVDTQGYTGSYTSGLNGCSRIREPSSSRPVRSTGFAATPAAALPKSSLLMLR
ncbi:hypothetical protein [Myxococcus sp. CA039A]|uniref:hypothetical protein n=1 Tax=Myxococcus sp. CA039A TaxID=2741737 RepID=UPI00157BA495|nr:hypothetical protein [Myxococcus sp. CA039A]NTX57415.1 hypothetical protein [Myxococcus sp. CA039A]